jgi:hypothetical protein
VLALGEEFALRPRLHVRHAVQTRLPLQTYTRQARALSIVLPNASELYCLDLEPATLAAPMWKPPKVCSESFTPQP